MNNYAIVRCTQCKKLIKETETYSPDESGVRVCPYCDMKENHCAGKTFLRITDFDGIPNEKIVTIVYPGTKS
jgi:NAD-dependent SIR2 family protein deacetylase